MTGSQRSEDAPVVTRRFGCGIAAGVVLLVGLIALSALVRIRPARHVPTRA
jgi:hypothetical protein